MNRILLLTSVAIAAIISYYFFSSSSPKEAKLAVSSMSKDEAEQPMVVVNSPASLSTNAEIGKKAFEANCASCHGISATGKKGFAPPLIHKIYEPSHHGDEAFQRAVALGVRAHHWSFGDMPKVEGLRRADVTYIIKYIREVQVANGIN